MNEGLISGRYAKALYKHCLEAGNAAQVYAQMTQLANTFESDKRSKERAVRNDGKAQRTTHH